MVFSVWLLLTLFVRVGVRFLCLGLLDPRQPCLFGCSITPEFVNTSHLRPGGVTEERSGSGFVSTAAHEDIGRDKQKWCDMADLHTITINLHDIRTRAEAVSQIRINRNTTPEEGMRAAMYDLERAIDECRLAEYALKVEQQKSDETMIEAGYEVGAMGEDSPIARQMAVFRQYAETFARRVAAIERALEDRSEKQTTPETTSR